MMGDDEIAARALALFERYVQVCEQRYILDREWVEHRKAMEEAQAKLPRSG